MKTLTLFNHKGGVGKTTLTINLADTLVDMGFRVLLVDADPQCNLTAFHLEEEYLDNLLAASDNENTTDGTGTIWSAIKPVVDGKGPIKDVAPIDLDDGKFLCPGDVLLADYEEELPAAWLGAFSRRQRDYNVLSAISLASRRQGKKCGADFIIFDVGPNVGPLNRVILLDSDYFATPVAADLFSLRALSTVGRSLGRWITDWKTVRELALAEERKRLFHGKPKYLGYITSAYKVSSGRTATRPHEYWEGKIAPRVKSRIIADLGKVDKSLLPRAKSNKIGVIKNFHSLAPQAQANGLAIGKLKGIVNAGYYGQVEEAEAQFKKLAREMLKRMGHA